MKYIVITNSSKKLNLRLSPTTSAPIVGYLYKDNEYIFDRLSADESWAHTCEGEGGAMGWASMDYLVEVEEGEKPSAPSDDTGWIVGFTKEELEEVKAWIESYLGGD